MTLSQATSLVAAAVVASPRVSSLAGAMAFAFSLSATAPGASIAQIAAGLGTVHHFALAAKTCSLFLHDTGPVFILNARVSEGDREASVADAVAFVVRRRLALAPCPRERRRLARALIRSAHACLF